MTEQPRKIVDQADADASSKTSEQVIVALLFAVGGLGVFLGLMSPNAVVEMSVGALMVFLAVAWKLVGLVRRS